MEDYLLVGIGLSKWVVLKIHFLTSINKMLINVFKILMFEQYRSFDIPNKVIYALGKVTSCLFKILTEQFMKVHRKGIHAFYLT